MAKKLSICMPTYNRKDYLCALLDSIAGEIRQYELQQFVEILVSDNASSDETSVAIQPYLDVVQYSRNDVNIGPDANFLKLFANASGEYIWLPGDDDKIRVDSIRYILQCINSEQFDYLYLRTSGVISSDSSRSPLRLPNDELLMRVNIFTTFMTSQVIRSSLIKKNLDAAQIYLGGYMAYYWIFLEALFASKVCLVSSQQEVYPNEDENTGGYRFYSVWANSVFDVLKASSFGGRKDIFACFRSRMFYTILLPITYRMRFGSKGFKFQSEDPLKSMAKYFGSEPYRTIFLCYMRMPAVLLSPLRFVVRLAGRGVKIIHRSIV